MSLTVETKRGISPLKILKDEALSLVQSLRPHLRLLLLLGIPLLALMYYPLRWCSAIWFGPEAQLTFQAWVPLGAIVIAWSRRDLFTKTLNDLAELFPNPDSPQRRGNLLLVVLGLIGMGFAYLMAMAPLAILAFVVILAGMLFYLWGPFLLREVLLPLAVVFLMVPLPNGLLGAMTQRLQQINTAVAGQALEVLHIPVRLAGSSLILKSNSLDLVATASYSGIALCGFLLLGTLFGVLIYRSTFGRGVLLLAITLVLGVVLNICRLIGLAIVGNFTPALARWLHDLPLLPVLLWGWLLILFLGRRILRTPRLEGVES